MKKNFLLLLLLTCTLINCLNGKKGNNNLLNIDKLYTKNNELDKEAIIFKKKTCLYEENNFTSKKLYNFKAGETVEIIGLFNKIISYEDSNNIWYNVKYKNYEGWIFGSDLGFLPTKTEDGYLLVVNEINDVKEFYESQYVYKIKSNLIYFSKKNNINKKLLSMKEYKDFQIKKVSFNDFNNDGFSELILKADIVPINYESNRIWYAYIFNEKLIDVDLLFYWYDINGGDNSIVILNKSQFNKDEINLDYVFSYYGGESIYRTLMDIQGIYYEIKLIYKYNEAKYSISKIELNSIKYKNTPRHTTSKEGIIFLDSKNIESFKKDIISKLDLEKFLSGIENGQKVQEKLELVESFIYE